jgi:integrase
MLHDIDNGPRTGATVGGLATEGATPVTHASSHGAPTRRPVYTGNRRVPGLYERTLANGSTVYDAALRLGGKARRHRLSATTKTDAINELRALQVDYERGEAHRSPAAGLTLEDLARDYLTHLRLRTHETDPRRRRSLRTVEHYEAQLRLHVLPLLGHLPAAELTVADVRRLLDALAAKRLSSWSRSGLVSILSGTLTYGVRQGVVAHNVVRDIGRDDRPGAQRKSEPRYLSPDELDALLVKMGDTFRPVAASCAYAGLRLSEALGLRWRDVDFEGGTLTVSAQLGQDGTRVPLKTAASAATVPLLPKLAAELKAHRSRVAGQALARVHADEFVFTTSRGRPHGSRNVLRAVYAAGDAAKLNGERRERVGVHDLRHSFVAVALAAGLTLPEAAALARHASPRVTASVYAGLTDAARAGLGEKLASAFGG